MAVPVKKMKQCDGCGMYDWPNRLFERGEISICMYCVAST